VWDGVGNDVVRYLKREDSFERRDVGGAGKSFRGLRGVEEPGVGGNSCAIDVFSSENG
jgi:hypothetical protein